MLPQITIANKLISKFLIVAFLCFGILLMHPAQVRAEGSPPNVTKKTDCFLVFGQGTCGSKDSTSKIYYLKQQMPHH